jgi:hypothetical protein
MSREDLVRRAIAAVNQRDIDAYLACCTDDVELHTPLASFVGTHKGPQGIRRFFGGIEDAAPDFRLELERLRLVGDRVLAFVQVRASGRTTSLPLDLETANVYDFEGDHIKSIRIFADRAEAREAVGLP